MVRGEQQTVKKPLDSFALEILALAATHLCQQFYTSDTFLAASTCNLLKYGLQMHFSFCSVPESAADFWAVYL